MSAPQISDETFLDSIDRILDQARTELRVLDEIADNRTLTTDEVDEVRYLRKLIDAQVRFRGTLVA